jgi:hypothetical protein
MAVPTVCQVDPRGEESDGTRPGELTRVRTNPQDEAEGQVSTSRLPDDVDITLSLREGAINGPDLVSGSWKRIFGGKRVPGNANTAVGVTSYPRGHREVIFRTSDDKTTSK